MLLFQLVMGLMAFQLGRMHDKTIGFKIQGTNFQNLEGCVLAAETLPSRTTFSGNICHTG